MNPGQRVSALEGCAWLLHRALDRIEYAAHVALHLIGAPGLVARVMRCVLHERQRRVQGVEKLFPLLHQVADVLLGIGHRGRGDHVVRAHCGTLPCTTLPASSISTWILPQFPSSIRSARTSARRVTFTLAMRSAMAPAARSSTA